MGIFGWDYPPGCSGTPYDEDQPCDVCGGYDTDGPNGCVCPKCIECGEVGDPYCYSDHGMVLSLAQKRQQEHALATSACVDETLEERWAPFGSEWQREQKEDV